MKYLALSNGNIAEKSAISTSVGVNDAGKIIETDIDGKVHISLISTGMGTNVGVYTVGEQSLTAGMFVTFNSDGNIRRASYAVFDAPACGFVLSNASSGATVTVYFQGINNKLSGLTSGVEYYLADDGQVRKIIPTLSEGTLQKVGLAISTTSILFQKNPYFKFSNESQWG